MDGVGWEYVAETNQEESELFTIYQGLDDTIGSILVLQQRHKKERGLGMT